MCEIGDQKVRFRNKGIKILFQDKIEDQNTFKSK
jgi:hypothetical protein